MGFGRRAKSSDRPLDHDYGFGRDSADRLRDQLDHLATAAIRGRRREAATSVNAKAAATRGAETSRRRVRPTRGASGERLASRRQRRGGARPKRRPSSAMGGELPRSLRARGVENKLTLPRPGWWLMRRGKPVMC